MDLNDVQTLHRNSPATKLLELRVRDAVRRSFALPESIRIYVRVLTARHSAKRAMFMRACVCVRAHTLNPYSYSPLSFRYYPNGARLLMVVWLCVFVHTLGIGIIKVLAYTHTQTHNRAAQFH